MTRQLVERAHGQAPPRSLAAAVPAQAPSHPVLELQRTHGNRFVARMVAGRSAAVPAAPSQTIRRACADCGDGAPCADCADHASPVQRQAQEPGRAPPLPETCVPPAGYTSATCGGYRANSWWLPNVYVHNATCACRETPNDATAMCVRKFLQDRLAAAPAATKSRARAMKPFEIVSPTVYQAFVQAVLTPIIHRDHVDAYASCCCPAGPAEYASWIGVTTVPLPCPAVGWSIRQFGSCHGTPGTW